MKIWKIISLLMLSIIFCGVEVKGFANSAYGDVIWSNNYEQIRQNYQLGKYNDGYSNEGYRQVYPDIKNNQFDIYWGQSFDELSADYELKWGVWGTDIAHYALQLNKIYKKGSPYLVLWFNKEKLYRIWMYYPRGLNQGKKHRKRVENYLIEKFGTPTVHGENILCWEDTSIKVNEKEEQKLEKKFYHNVFHAKKHIKWNKNDNK